MNKTILLVVVINLIFISGCIRVFQDTNIKCDKTINWNGEQNLDCQIWIKKIVEGIELGHSENYDCHTSDLTDCCTKIKQYMEENKNGSIYYGSINNVQEIKCTEGLYSRLMY